jgi:hypothetical protein
MNWTSWRRGLSAGFSSDTKVPSQLGGKNFVAESMRIEAVKVPFVGYKRV